MQWIVRPGLVHETTELILDHMTSWKTSARWCRANITSMHFPEKGICNSSLLSYDDSYHGVLLPLHQETTRQLFPPFSVFVQNEINFVLLIIHLKVFRHVLVKDQIWRWVFKYIILFLKCIYVFKREHLYKSTNHFLESLTAIETHLQTRAWLRIYWRMYPIDDQQRWFNPLSS